MRVLILHLYESVSCMHIASLARAYGHPCLRCSDTATGSAGQQQYGSQAAYGAAQPEAYGELGAETTLFYSELFKKHCRSCYELYTVR